MSLVLGHYLRCACLATPVTGDLYVCVCFDLDYIVPSLSIVVIGTDGDTIGKFIEQILAPVVAVLVLIILLVLVVVITLYLTLQLRMRYMFK